MVFTAFTALAWTCFTNQHEQGPAKAFEPSWWFWLVATGLGLGGTASVKWVGLFTIAWVGSLTLLQLWVLLGDTRTVTPVSYLSHRYVPSFTNMTFLALVVEALPRPRFLVDHHPHHLLHGDVCYPLSLSCQPRRWRRFHVIRVPGDSQL